MPANNTTSNTRRAYAFIEANRDEYSVKTMCRALGVARAGYKSMGSDSIDLQRFQC